MRLSPVCIAGNRARTILTSVIQNHELPGTFVEIIGQVTGESTIKFMQGLNLETNKELGKYAFFVLLTWFMLFHRHEVGE